MVKSDWKLPTEFPDLSGAKEICVDTETRDDELKTKGPGVRRGGYLVGVALATNDGFRGYYPFDHESGTQFDRDKIHRYLREQLALQGQPKIGANILYDLDYLEHAGIKVRGPFFDIQVAEPLIDENRPKSGGYSLDTLAKDYLGEEEGKDENLMDAYAASRGWTGKSVAHLWRMPPEYVGPYAEADVDRTLRIWERQQPLLDEEALSEVFDMETRLIPMLLQMRQQGVLINVEKTEQLIEETEKKIQGLVAQIRKDSGINVDIWAARSLAKAFDRLRLKYPRTAKTNEPSFTAQWLERHSHPVAQAIREARKLDKFVGTFLKGQINDLHINGRLHPQFNQLRGDEYGTVTGRFSCSLPNLQFIPNRDPVLGPLTRSLFLPESDCDWGRADYSQIEIRILAHYARGASGRAIVRAFCEDPNLDYHQWGADNANIDRKQAKTINFGVIYGMGVQLLASQLGLTYNQAKSLLDVYHDKLPFLRQTTSQAMRIAQGRGYVKTILGRRRRFNRWEPRDWKLARAHPELAANDRETCLENIRGYIRDLKEAGVKGKDAPFPKVAAQRFGTYKAFNAIDQGSAADIMKKAMVDCYEAGIFDKLPCHLTVHDELDVSVPRTKEGREAFKEMVHLMENTYKLKVPMIVDSDTGDNWGDVA
jgi:DNA polymerase I-like protein with 3'-5' exonuclease and polymerase domains